MCADLKGAFLSCIRTVIPVHFICFRLRPKWIFLENVAAFYGSVCLSEWKVCLRECGYSYKEVLRSPVSYGVPNHRLRYYMLIEYGHRFDAAPVVVPPAMPCTVEDDQTTGAVVMEGHAVSSCDTDHTASESNKLSTRENICSHAQIVVTDSGSGEEVNSCTYPGPPSLDSFVVPLSGPTKPLSHYLSTIESAASSSESSGEASSTSCGAAVLDNRTISSERLQHLLVPTSILGAAWAGSRLSIVSRFDRTSYCFTKSYGRKFDKSSGSCLYMSALGPMAKSDFSIDRSHLLAYNTHIRLFDPSELLRLFGFPAVFSWPHSQSTVSTENSTSVSAASNTSVGSVLNTVDDNLPTTVTDEPASAEEPDPILRPVTNEILPPDSQELSPLRVNEVKCAPHNKSETKKRSLRTSTETSLGKQWACIGNSINVTVVTHLMGELFASTPPDTTSQE